MGTKKKELKLKELKCYKCEDFNRDDLICQRHEETKHLVEGLFHCDAFLDLQKYLQERKKKICLICNSRFSDVLQKGICDICREAKNNVKVQMSLDRFK